MHAVTSLCALRSVETPFLVVCTMHDYDKSRTLMRSTDNGNTQFAQNGVMHAALTHSVLGAIRSPPHLRESERRTVNRQHNRSGSCPELCADLMEHVSVVR